MNKAQQRVKAEFLFSYIWSTFNHVIRTTWSSGSYLLVFVLIDLQRQQEVLVLEEREKRSLVIAVEQLARKALSRRGTEGS